MNLRVKAVYILSNLNQLVWNNKNERFGQPSSIVGIYLGCLSGERTWHLFEVRYDDKDAGTILMNDSDLNKIIIKEL